LFHFVNSVEVNRQQFYLESIGRALAASLVFHAALFVASELSQHFRWWKKPAWSIVRLAEQKGALFEVAKKLSRRPLARFHPFRRCSTKACLVPPQPAKSVPAKTEASNRKTCRIEGGSSSASADRCRHRQRRR
jgi:hypothetical protein